MTIKEYNEADRDVEVICGVNHKRRREAEERMIATAYMDAPFEECGDLMAYRQAQLKRVVFTCARIVPGMMFLGAIPRGWMEPVFAAVCALGCFIGAAWYYRRGFRYGQ